MKMNITVYLGANAGNDPKLQEAVEALGKWIGENGMTSFTAAQNAG